MQFQFPSTKKEYEVLNSKGDVLKKYYIDVGNVNTIKTIFRQITELKDIFAECEKSGYDEAFVDKLVAAQKYVINALLDNDYDFLWMESGENIFVMNSIIEQLYSLIKDAAKER